MKDNKPRLWRGGAFALEEGVEERNNTQRLMWYGFYIANPHLYYMEILGIELSIFQQLVLFLSCKWFWLVKRFGIVRLWRRQLRNLFE